jgi:hypothetical protein
MDLAKESSNQEMITLVEEWNLRSATMKSASLNIVDIN